MNKPWWISKTIWTNAIALAGSIFLSFGVDATAWAKISITALAVINVILRLMTHEAIQGTPGVE